MAKRNRSDRSVLRFDDTITLYNKIDDDTWKRTVVKGVQWSDHTEKTNNSGKIDVATYANITFPEGTYEEIELDPRNEEDAIAYGEIDEEVTGQKGHRISDLLQNHKAGLIKSVNDNTNRDYLKHKKVVVG